MSNYRDGRATEYAVRDALEDMGAYPVIRAAGSKGVADLIAAFGPRRTMFVQVKRNAWPTPAERDAMWFLFIATGWEPWCARWEARKPLRWGRIRLGGILDEGDIR